MAADTTTTGKAKRVVKRLTADERKAKAAASVDVEIAKAGTALVNAATGLVARGDRAAAKRALETWELILDIVQAPATDNGSEPTA